MAPSICNNCVESNRYLCEYNRCLCENNTVAILQYCMSMSNEVLKAWYSQPYRRHSTYFYRYQAFLTLRFWQIRGGEKQNDGFLG